MINKSIEFRAINLQDCFSFLYGNKKDLNKIKIIRNKMKIKGDYYC